MLRLMVSQGAGREPKEGDGMRMIEKVEGTCDPCPELTQIERPVGGLLADVYVRGNHMGANVWIFTVYASLANAQAQTSPAGVAGSEFPEESGLWPVTNNPPYAPNTTDWVLHVVLPETAPAAPCYVIWSWTSDYAGTAVRSVCDLLAQYTGDGQALNGATVQCGDPGAQHPATLVYVVAEDVEPRTAPGGYSTRGVGIRVGIRVSRADMGDLSAANLAQHYAGAIASIVHERRGELGIGQVEFAATPGAVPDAGSPVLYAADVRFTLTSTQAREA